MSEYRGGLHEFAERLTMIVYPDRTLTSERFEALKVAYGLTEQQVSLYNAYWETVMEDVPPGTDRFCFRVLEAVYSAIRALLFGV